MANGGQCGPAECLIETNTASSHTRCLPLRMWVSHAGALGRRQPHRGLGAERPGLDAQ